LHYRECLDFYSVVYSFVLHCLLVTIIGNFITIDLLMFNAQY
jgi:hypothetical protein